MRVIYSDGRVEAKLSRLVSRQIVAKTNAARFPNNADLQNKYAQAQADLRTLSLSLRDYRRAHGKGA